MTVDLNSKPVELSPETVPLGTGLPTREELLVHYPAKFTWHQLKVFVNSGYVSSASVTRSQGMNTSAVISDC